LGAENAGVKLSDKGMVECKSFTNNIPNIYAIGDVVQDVSAQKRGRRTTQVI
jgi:pyruvate/2-oxoglutarate dehydrogenase complex dihydrolipoamide dehydrogenase (E3) component